MSKNKPPNKPPINTQSTTKEIPKLPKKQPSLYEGPFTSQSTLIKPHDVVVSLIFDFLLDSIIEDHVVIEVSKESIESFEMPLGSIMKNFKDVELEEILNFDIISINGSNVVLMPKSSHSISSSKKAKPKSKFTCTCLNFDSSTARKSTSSKASKKNTARSSTKSKENIQSSSAASVDSFSKYSRHEAYITFTNGNVYEGEVFQRLMDGKGKFTWGNGTIYQGEFENGYPTGKGAMTLPELSRYDGQFYKGFFHGEGVFYVSLAPMFYNGGWRHGKLHGKGWLLYEPNNWYDGEWFGNIRHGSGERQYPNGVKYKGKWHQGIRSGQGTMIWENNDHFKGEWFNGVMNGYGEYIWKAFLNKTFSFPIQNFYKGQWVDGQRTGLGIMNFGTESGAKLAGFWERNLKHGEGIMICGNGKFVEGNPLFKYDKPCNIFYSPNSDLLPTASLKNISKEIDLNLSDNRSNSNIMYGEDGLNCSCDFTRTLEIENKFLELPIFTVTELVDLGYYIDVIIRKFVNFCQCESQETCTCDPQEVVDAEGLRLIKTNEENAIRNIIRMYSPKLSTVYNKYASIAVQQKLQFKPVMIRMFLWQFYRDIEITKKGFTLIDIDIILAHNQYSGIDRNSHPFETIYFWQFLMFLVSTALLVNSKEKFVDQFVQEGTLALILKKFLDEVVFVTKIKHKGLALFECKDLLPIQKVYLLYKDLGNPLITVKDFLRYTCVKKKEKPLCHLSNLFREQCNIINGTNSVLIGNNISFFKPQTIGEKPDNVIMTPKTYNLIVLRRLGPKNVFRCLANICPLITSDGILTNIDYPLNFIEFYEALLACTSLLVKQRLKKEIEKQQEIEANELTLQEEIEGNQNDNKPSENENKMSDKGKQVDNENADENGKKTNENKTNKEKKNKKKGK